MTSAKELLDKYPNRVPIYVEKSKYCKELGDIDKNKYLVPKDLTVGQFMYVIRQRISLKPEKALFLYIKYENRLPPSSELLCNIYDKYKSQDELLYMTYQTENTFG